MSAKHPRQITLLVLLLLGFCFRSIAYSQEISPVLVSDIDWSPDGSRIAVGYSQWRGLFLQSCSDTDILFVDVITQQRSLFPRGYDRCSPATVDFDTTGSAILVASESMIEIWDLVTGLQVNGFRMGTIFQSASYSSDGSEILVTIPVDVTIENAALTGSRQVFSLPESGVFIHSIWARDGRYVASSMDNGDIYVWHTLGGRIIARFQEHTAQVKRLAWNPVSDIIASGDDSGIIWLWDALTGQPIRQLTGHTGIVYDVDWHPDGQLLASAGEDGTIRVWDVASGTMQIVDTSETFFSAAAYSPDGTMLAYAGAFAGEDTAIEIIPFQNDLHVVTDAD